MRNKLFAMILCSLLAACSSGAAQVQTVVAKSPPVAVPVVQPITVLPVEWQVLNAAGVQALATKLATSKQGVVLFALDPHNFKNLNLNLVDIQRYMKDQQTVVLMLTKIVNNNSQHVPTLQNGLTAKEAASEALHNTAHALAHPITTLKDARQKVTP